MKQVQVYLSEMYTVYVRGINTRWGLRGKSRLIKEKQRAGKQKRRLNQ